MLIDSLYKINMPRTVSVGEGRENTSTDTGFGGPVLGQWLQAVYRFGCLCGGLGYIYMKLYKKAANISTPHNVRELYPSSCYSSIFVYLLRV